jgi:hypothetical protein
MSAKRKAGSLLAIVSALLWAAAAWVGITFEGVTGPTVLLGWLMMLAVPMTVAAAVLLAIARRDETRKAGRR